MQEKVSIASVTYPTSTNTTTTSAGRVHTSVLSSPDIIKSVSRNLTPPIPPTYCNNSKSTSTENSIPTIIPISDPIIDANWPGRPKRNNFTGNSPSPPSSVGNDQKGIDHNSQNVIVPPRRTRRQMSSPTFKKQVLTNTENERNGNQKKKHSPPLQVNLAAAQINLLKINSSETDPIQGYNNNSSVQVSNHSSKTKKPPIFPSSPPSSASILPKSSNEKITHESSNQVEEKEASENMPPFMREFVMRRKNSQREFHNEFNPDEKAPPQFPTPMKKPVMANSALPCRPHSAFIPRAIASDSKDVSAAKKQLQNSESQVLEGNPISESSKPLPPARRRSDFVTRYEYLMDKAQKAIQVVDKYESVVNKRQSVTESNITQGDSSDKNNITQSNEAKGLVGCGDEDDDEIEDVDFNEEEVLRKCRDFISDYDKNKQQRGTRGDINKTDKVTSSPTSVSSNIPPVPKPRHNFNLNINKVAFGDSTPSSSGLISQEPENNSIRARASSLTLHDKRFHNSNTSTNDDPDKECCPNNKYYETSPQRLKPNETSSLSVTRNSTPISMPKPILKKSSEDLIRISEFSDCCNNAASNTIFNSLSSNKLQPSSSTSTESKTPIPILKNKDPFSMDGANPKSFSISEKGNPLYINPATEPATSVSSILKQRNLLGDPAEAPSGKPDHVRIRSPSPDLDDFVPRPILRSRNNSVGACTTNNLTSDNLIIGKGSRASSPELGSSNTHGSSSVSFQPQSILKRRSSEAEDLDTIRSFGGHDMSGATSGHTSGATSRSSPEHTPHGILKQRKWSVGSGSHSPDSSAIGCHSTGGVHGVSISGAIISSILKKRSGSQHESSNQGSLEDLTSGGSSLHDGGIMKSILKKTGHNSSGHASNASGIGCSTDDELEENFEFVRSRPANSRKPRRSILKSRRSEESLSPLSDPNLYDSGTAGFGNSANNGVEFEEGITPIPVADFTENGLDSSSSSKSPGIRPILKQRDKSKSPTRGSTSTRSVSPLDGSSGFSSAAATTPGATSSTPPITGTTEPTYGPASDLASRVTLLPSPIPRRSSLTFSPIKKSQHSTGSDKEKTPLYTDNCNADSAVVASPVRKPSFVSQKFIELSPARKLSNGNSLVPLSGVPISSHRNPSNEKPSSNEPGSPDLIERVTFATEALTLKETKSIYDRKSDSCNVDPCDEGRLPSDETKDNRSFSPIQSHSYGSILKRKGSKKETKIASENAAEHESNYLSPLNPSLPIEDSASQGTTNSNHSVLPRARKKSILRKDSSYEDNLRPILKNSGEFDSNTDSVNWPELISSKSEARLLSPQTTNTQTKEMEEATGVPQTYNTSEDESSDEIQAGRPFSDVIIDKPTSTTSSLHNLDMDYLIDDDENSDSKISPLEEENLEDEEIQRIFGSSNIVNNPKLVGGGSGSSDDLEEFCVSKHSAFNDVIIDPIPGAANVFSSGSGNTLNSPIKSSASGSSSRKTSNNLLARQPVISPSSVKISSDGNLADKLQHLTDTAETIKLQMLKSSKKSVVNNHGFGFVESKKPNNGLAENAFIGGPKVIDLDAAALPPSGTSSNILNQTTLASAATEFPQSNQGWNTAAIPPLNKR